MPEADVISKTSEDILNRAVTESIRADRQQLASAKESVLRLLKEAGPDGNEIDLRREMFHQHRISTKYTLAALRELTREGKVEVGPNFEYRLPS